MDHFKSLSILFRGSWFFQRQLGLSHNDRHGCSKLVRGIRGELLLCFKGMLQPVQHIVKGRSHVIKFGIDVFGLQTAVQVLALRDLGDGLFNPAYRGKASFRGDPDAGNTDD